MRQAGHLPTESAARQFAAWLIAQKIDAHAELEGQLWTIWVREEDQLQTAREALEHFKVNPQDARYRNAESLAAARLLEEDRQRQAAKGKVVTMRDRWGAPGGMASRRCPLVLAIIGISIVTSLFAQTLSGDKRPPESFERRLLFVDPATDDAPTQDVWASLRDGQIWRLVTPIFIHYGVMHLVFNLLWLYDMGGQVETRRGTLYLLGLVLALAMLSNIGQALESSFAFGSPRFGGLSGVVYGLIGYVFVKTRFDNTAGYNLSPSTMFLAMLWFVLCIARDYPPFDSMLAGWIPKIANSAHAVGLFAGMAIAYAPLLVRRSA